MPKLSKNFFDPWANGRDRSNNDATASATGIVINPSGSRRFSVNSKVARSQARKATHMKLERILEKTANR
jgi:hypothetical protein